MFYEEEHNSVKVYKKGICYRVRTQKRLQGE